MSCNLGTIIGGPAVVKFKGQTFFSKGDISVANDLETFTVDVDAFGGPVEARESNAPLSVTFTPAGEWEALSVLFPYGSPVIGGSINAVTRISAIDAGANTMTATNHRLRTGAPVQFAAIGQGVQGLTMGNVYYARAVDANTITAHASESDATGNTGAIDITAIGTGETRVIEQEPLIIQTLTGEVITFHVAAVSAMPDLNLASTQTLLGSVTFEVFRKNGTPASTADSRYTISSAAYADTTFDPVNIVTQPYTAAWGAVAPWDSFSSKNGFRVSFPMNLVPIEDDACGIIGRRLTGVRAEVRGQPTNVNESAALSKLLLQGAGAGRGRRLIGDDLILTATGVYVAIYGASLIAAPQLFSSQADRAGEFVWSSARKFTAGVPGAVFYVGTAAP